MGLKEFSPDAHLEYNRDVGGEFCMNIEQAIADLSAVPISDRLRIVAAIWDSLSDDELPDPPAAQVAELNRRMAAHRSDPSSAISADELEHRLANHFQK